MWKKHDFFKGYHIEGVALKRVEMDILA